MIVSDPFADDGARHLSNLVVLQYWGPVYSVCGNDRAEVDSEHLDFQHVRMALYLLLRGHQGAARGESFREQVRGCHTRTVALKEIRHEVIAIIVHKVYPFPCSSGFMAISAASPSDKPHPALFLTDSRYTLQKNATPFIYSRSWHHPPTDDP